MKTGLAQVLGTRAGLGPSLLGPERDIRFLSFYLLVLAQRSFRSCKLLQPHNGGPHWSPDPKAEEPPFKAKGLLLGDHSCGPHRVPAGSWAGALPSTPLVPSLRGSSPLPPMFLPG